VEIELAFELIENFITFVDVELFAAIGAAVDDRDEIRVLPDGAAPVPISLFSSIHCRRLNLLRCGNISAPR
jgi:hypothetical protein